MSFKSMKIKSGAETAQYAKFDPPPSAGDLRKNRVLPTVFVFLASVIWGATFVTQKLAGEHVGSFTYNGLRFALGAVTLLPIILLLEKTDRAKSRLTLRAGIIGGLILFAASNLQQFGIALSSSPTSASEAGFITGLYTVFTPILGMVLGRKTNVLTWVSAVMAFCGLTLISVGPGGLASVQFSDVYLVMGAVFWAAHILLVDRYASIINPIRFTAIQFAVSAVLSLIAAASFETISLDGIRGGLFPILFGGVIACGLSYVFQILGQRGVAPAKAAIIFSLEALFAAISEAVWFGEFMTARKYLGGAIILAGVFLSQATFRRRDRKLAQPEQ